MDPISDQDYLKKEQYRKSDRLDARVQLHRRFSTNPTVYFEWMYDHLQLQSNMRVLEAGCGTGELWRANLQRLPDGLKITLFDLSTGMAADTRTTVSNDSRFNLSSADAQHLPFASSQFQRVIANYMLYHVPDISQAVRELRRVLVPGGVLCAATNSNNHMRELHELLLRFGLSVNTLPDFAARYGLENAPQILGEHFDRVEVIPFVDSLFVTDATALTAYIRSMSGMWHFVPGALEDLEQWVVEEIRTKGGLSIQKASGLVLAW
ncbi:MAG: class I SAM-dependent methyltransferase [Bellilinea sp.]